MTTFRNWRPPNAEVTAITERLIGTLLDQQRKNDHLHPTLRDIVAVDQAFAAGGWIFYQRAITARMRTALDQALTDLSSLPGNLHVLTILKT